MERKVIITKDGSHSISIPEMNVTYHSIHGAIQESKHVFIEAGLRYASELFNRLGPLHILEVGFGTGLNALLTLIEADKIKMNVHYSALELYPLTQQEYNFLNYCEALNVSLQNVFEQLHECVWEKEAHILPNFSLFKTNQSLLNFTTDQFYDLVYFDAFAPSSQPELWTKQVFEKLYAMMSSNGILVTYCSKGDVRRAMQSAGFAVEKIPGPVGKREMIRCKPGLKD